MNAKKWLVLSLCAAVLLIAVLVIAYALENREPDYNDRETFADEVTLPVSDEAAGLQFSGNLTVEAYAGTAVGEWLAGCTASDRDEQLNTYVLRHEATAEGMTTFTYLVYYPHGAQPLSPAAAVLEGESGYRVELTYTADTAATADYSLCWLSVRLPTEKAPRLRLLVDGDTLGSLVTVTGEEIPRK